MITRAQEQIARGRAVEHLRRAHIAITPQETDWGTLYPYVEGEPTSTARARPPRGREGTYTFWHEIVLQPGEQYSVPPNTKH